MAQVITTNKGLQNVILFKSFRAGEAITKRRWVELDNVTHQVDQIDSVTSVQIGVAQNDVAANEIVNVAMAVAGSSIACEASKAIAVGAPVYLSANGRVSDSSSSSARRVGTALDAAGAAGDLIQVLVGL